MDYSAHGAGGPAGPRVPIPITEESAREGTDEAVNEARGPLRSFGDPPCRPRRRASVALIGSLALPSFRAGASEGRLGAPAMFGDGSLFLSRQDAPSMGTRVVGLAVKSDLSHSGDSARTRFFQ